MYCKAKKSFGAIRKIKKKKIQIPLNKFSKKKKFKNFRIALKFFFALHYIKTEQKLFLGKKKFVPEKESCYFMKNFF